VLCIHAEEGKDKPAERYVDVKEEEVVVDGSNYDEQVSRTRSAQVSVWGDACCAIRVA